jgi:hypothetical protein
MAEAAQARGDVALSTSSLVKLVKMDLAAGEEAGLAHYERAGRRLLLLKERVASGQWQKWVRKNFDLSPRTAGRYMQAAERNASLEADSGRRAPVRTLSAASGDDRGDHTASWVKAAREEHAKYAADVREQAARATAHHRSQRETRWAEQRAVRAHADGIINAGYRVYAPRFHPDHGGDPREMVRVNKARDGLRKLVKML